MIEVRNLHYTIQQKPLLRDMTFTVKPGVMTVILGANGAGKSTLLRCLTGLNRPSGGTIMLDGKSLEDYSLLELSQRRAVLSQAHSIVFPMTAMEIVMMGRNPYHDRSQSSADIEIAQHALDTIDAYHLKDRVFSTLSGGEQQRIHIARVLCQIWQQESAYIFLDEPTSALDLKHQHLLMQLAQQLCAPGRTVICILHDLNLVRSYCDEVLMLVDGALSCSGSVSQIVTPDIIAESYGLEGSVKKAFFTNFNNGLAPN